MHPCLNVDEIIRLIAFELVTSQAKATAVSFACNSKNFEDPVLDTLWETQDELLPLLKSLPIDIWLGRTKCTVSVPTTRILPFLTVRFDSLSKDSRQCWSGLVSGSTPEGCEGSKIVAIYATCLRRRYRLCSFVPSKNPKNPCFQTWKLSSCRTPLDSSSRSSTCSFPLELPQSTSHSMNTIPPNRLSLRWSLPSPRYVQA